MITILCIYKSSAEKTRTKFGLHVSLPGLNAYGLSFHFALENKQPGGRVVATSSFQQEAAGFYGETSELSARYNYSCQPYDWCFPPFWEPNLLAMSEMARKKREIRKEKKREWLCLRSEAVTAATVSFLGARWHLIDILSKAGSVYGL